MYDFNIQAVEEQVLELMRANGCEPEDPSHLDLDGQIHRYRVRGDKHGTKNGAYCIFTDNWPAGWIQNWKTGAAISWSYPRDQLDQAGKDWYTDERYKEACRLSEEHQKQLKAELEAKQQAATLEARKFWESLAIEVNHDFPYLQAKNISGNGVRLWVNTIPYGNPHNDELVVPMWNIARQVQTLQFIDKDGNKRFYTGAPVKGAFFSIGLDACKADTGLPILICEGYATAATIYECTSYPTVAAMNAGNIQPVAHALKGEYPEHRILIMADNDRHADGSNPGLEKAIEAVKKLGLRGVIAPQFGEHEAGSDWNDYASLHGLQATSKLLKEQISWELMSSEEREEAATVKRLNGLARELDKNIQIPPEDFIAGMFPRKRISAVIAAPGTGKTWFL